ncbi:MAG: imidazole glycerol phosphate synthase subunit HisH [Nitrospirae bacterium]|nr:imidazole glycerol phosphate synthase subunit HisH [Nitrospirota bacterium]
MIAIVDYGMGNIRSVEKGFAKIGADARITASPVDIANASAVVLPGVGAFRDCMENLERLELLSVIVRAIKEGKPYLGICLGLQILFSMSEEFGLCKGLDVIQGKVVKFNFDAEQQTDSAAEQLKIPHMGWNTVSFSRRHPAFSEVADNAHFYFVHSYYVVPDDTSVTAGITNYGTDFTSVVWKDNVLAMQFHPEKSQTAGLSILKGFSDFAKTA